jgi:hypothetical protein
VFLHQRGELGAREVLEELIEQAGCGYDCLALLVGDVRAKLRLGKRSPTFNYRRAFLFRARGSDCFGQE